MKSAWGWMPERPEGMWRHMPAWFRSFYVAVPWLTVGVLLLMFHMIGGTLTKAEGIMFDLPEGNAIDGEATPLVALVLPLKDETCVFFDDARYSLDDGVSLASFGEHLAERAAKIDFKTLLVLSDRRVACEEITKISSVARNSGLERILVSSKSAEATKE